MQKPRAQYLKSDLDDVERRRHRPGNPAGNRACCSISQRALELPGLFHYQKKKTKSDLTNTTKTYCKTRGKNQWVLNQNSQKQIAAEEETLTCAWCEKCANVGKIELEIESCDEYVKAMKIISYNPREKEELERGIQEMREKVRFFNLGFWGSRILEDESRHWRTRERERQTAGFQGNLSFLRLRLR